MEVKIEVKDEILLKVINTMVDRSNAGIKKYGSTLQDDEGDFKYFLKQLQSELMDAVLYLEKSKEAYTEEVQEEALKHIVVDEAEYL